MPNRLNLTFTRHFDLLIYGLLLASAAFELQAQDLTTGLAHQWVADDYVNGYGWVDRVQGTVAALDGTPAPLAVTGVFGTHQGVQRNTGTTGPGGFSLPADTAPIGLTNYTVAIVFESVAAGPSSGNYYSDQIIFGYDIGGAGQPDWGISWGGNGSRAGQGVAAGIGRSDGDSGLQSANSPLALNVPHTAVLQISGTAGTETLFVDGAQTGQNTGLTILSPANSSGSGVIPLLSTVNANIANAFTGSLAEVRVYTNATVDGAALSTYLQNIYAANPTIQLTANGATLTLVGRIVSLQISIPAAASQDGSFTVNLASTDTGVVASTNITFPKGVTNANISLPVLGVGTTSVTASGSGVLSSVPVSISGYAPGMALPIAWFKADAITGVNDGSAVANWPDSSGNGYNATQGTSARDPNYVANAINGEPAVRFNSDNNTYLAFNRPVQDDFTIICVFQSTQGLNFGNLFYQGAGLVNGEVGGVVDDFGTCLFADGSICAGTGNPDVAVNSSGGYNDGQPHVFTFTRTRSTGLMSLYVDGTFVGTTTGGMESLNSPAKLVLGAQQTLNNFLSGDIAEVQVYNTALSGTNLQTVETSLFQKYQLPPVVPAGLYLQLQNGQVVLNWLPSSGATGYYIRRASSANGAFTTIATNSAATTFTDSSVSPTNVYYYAVSAFNANGTSANSTPAGTDTILSRNEPIGPSSRTTPIAISEIMWKPAPRTDGKNLEFVEIYNSNPWFQDISGYTLTCADMSYTFPSGTMIESNSFIVVAAAPVDIKSVYGATNVMGPYTGSLKKAEELQLLDEHSNVLLTVPYTGEAPWPVATDETGHSLILSNPSYGEGDPRAWDNSTFAGGSPGTADVYPVSQYGNVVINELLPHSENPSVPQFIELYNHGADSNDISGCVLTDDPTTNKFVIPPETVIGPDGFVTFTQSQFGFTLNGAGETLYLISADGSRILDAVQFAAQADGVSYGRSPDGADDFYAFTTRTPGTNNSAILIGNIVINELMFDPISKDDNDQYIELYNQGASATDLSGWQLTGGVSYSLPPGTTLAAGGYLVVARNAAQLISHYPNLNAANCLGNFSGKLSHNGELVMLSRPETIYTNTPIMVAEDQVTYGAGGRWGQWADGGGSSLELKNPRANHRLAANWKDSDETRKSAWTNIEFTGTLDNGFNFDPTIDYAQIGILDTGECLVDNVEVDDTNGVNYVSNPTFESGTNGWTFQGDHVRSSLENSGYQSSQSLHVRASDHYFNGDDSCQAALNANSFAAGQTATLQFKARWLHGWPEVILRLNGGWLEATGSLSVPTDLGTPGQPNSQAIASAGPAIHEVTHTPALPAASQPVVVTAQVNDPDGVKNLTLNYRLDPATTYTTVTMSDRGTDGDAVAGDGVFSAVIPGQAANQLVAFYISATNNFGVATRFPALLNDNTPARECLVLFGDGNPGGSFGVYHLWLTQANVTRWANLGNLSNEGIDGTMVYANRVIYNMQAHYAGSPVHQDYNTPTGNLCSYKWIFNDDDQFLGATSFNKIHVPGNTDNDPTYQREQLANSFLRALGVPWLNRRDVVVYVNGNRRGPFMEDAQTPGSDLVKEYFPNDTDGYLYKVTRWYEFGPFQSGYAQPNKLASEAMLLPFTTTGSAKKTARYRWSFQNRRTPDSQNNYTDLFTLIDAASVHGAPNYVANMENIADMENWMRVFAANHAAGNWDCFGCSSGQNLYAYTGTQGTKWSLMMFDFNIGLGIDGSYPPGQNLFTTLGADTNVTAIYNTPTFRRMYWRALGELVANGPLNLALSVPLMDAKYAAFTANGMTVEDPNLNLIPWLAQAGPAITSQFNAANAAGFTVDANVTVNGNVGTVTGQAPFAVATVLINNAAYPLTWTTPTTWSVTVPLVNGSNDFTVTGVDRNGQPIAGASGSANVNYNGTNPPPSGQIAINEIMYQPAVPNAEFVELYNTSTNTAFDLSGWNLHGLGYTFPAGALIGPTNYLVLAANRADYAAAYGATAPVFDTFSGTLSSDSETLALNTSNAVTVAQVKYDNHLPWPANADGTGGSLQLVDARQDNWRVGNWSVTPFSATPGAVNSVAAALTPFPPLWLNELQADNLNGITNRAGQHTPWLELYNPGNNVISLNGIYLANNYTNLTQWAFPTDAVINPGEFQVIFADGQTGLSMPGELHTSFTLPSSTGSLALTRVADGRSEVLDYVDYENVGVNDAYGSLPDGQSFDRQEFLQATPGAPNNGSAAPPSFVNYAVASSTYTQNFNTLPNPGASSVNADNPVTIAGVTYAPGNPFDFAGPAVADGGLGLSALAGWYGASEAGVKLGATDGDQTTGGQISFGLPNSGNRALGLLATSSTGGTSFGVRLINGTATTLNQIGVQAKGELWRQSNKSKMLTCYYYVDLSGTAGFPASVTAFLPALNVTFPTDGAASGGVAVDGTAPANQISLSVTGQTITNWPPGAALWLVWQMSDNTGKAQGLGVDDFQFNASGSLPSVSATVSGGNLFLSTPTVNGGIYQAEYKNQLTDPAWAPLGPQRIGTGNIESWNVDTITNAQRFYRLVRMN